MSENKRIAVLLRPGKHWNSAKSVREQDYWDDHARFIDELFAAGLIKLAGPFPDGSGALVIMNVESVEAARAIYARDPWAVQEILLTDEVKEWTVFLDAWNQNS